MLITFTKIQEGYLEGSYEPQPGDECEVYLDKQFLWLKIVQVDDNGYIRAEDDNGMRVDFPTKVELFEAIADV